jgi:TolB-like protein/Tfp pilus assembly protein PilF
MSSNEPHDRLESWKAIAGYLRRTERTARRWERHEGLPVHRLSHHDRSSVYAFKSELDAWRAARSAEPSIDQADRPRSSSRYLRYALIASVVAVIAAIGGYLWWGAPGPPATGVPTLAVLPFTIDSADAETEHLGGAIARSLVDQIARAPDLRVRPFASSMRNYREEEEPAAIGERMGVDMIVAGQVEARGDDLTIKVAMVDVTANSQIWGSSFEATYGELGRIQERMAQTLWAEASRHRNNSDHPLAPFDATGRLSRNSEAVRHFLRGVGPLGSPRRSPIQHSIDELHKAVELDPDFAAAHSMLSSIYIAYALYGDLPASETYPLAKTHALRAIALDPRSAYARRALAAVTHWYDFDHAAAEQQFLAAIEAAPNEAGTRNWYAEYLIDMRRFDEALAAARAAEERDPGWLVPQVNRGNVLLYSGHPEQAVPVYRQALEIDPGYGIARHQLAHAYVAMGRYSEAIPEFERANQDIGSTPFSMASLAYGLARAGRRAEAEEMLRDFERRRKAGFYPAFTLAKSHVGLGNVEQALDWLEIAVDEKLTGYYLPSVDQVWDPLRGHPRFQRVLQRFGVPDTMKEPVSIASKESSS